MNDPRRARRARIRLRSRRSGLIALAFAALAVGRAEAGTVILEPAASASTAWDGSETQGRGRPASASVVRSLVATAVETAARQHDVPAPFMFRLLGQESGFNAAAVSPAGAQGIAQFMPATARAMGLDDPFDPLKSVSASARYLGLLRRQFGNLGLAAAAYNAGPGRVQQWMSGQAALPAETVAYVRSVTGRSVLDWAPAAMRGSLRLASAAPASELGPGGWESRLLADLVKASAAPAGAKPALLFASAPVRPAAKARPARAARKLVGEAALCEAVSRPGATCVATGAF